MTTSVTELPFAAEDVATIALEVGMAVLDMALVQVEDDELDHSQGGATSCVHVTGDWEGSVVLRASTQLTRDGTATMFDLPPEEIGDEEMADALGELANIVGGSIKGLIPGSCRLSLPTVTLGPDSRMVVPGAELVHRVVLAAGEQQLVVALWKRPSGVPQHTG